MYISSNKQSMSISWCEQLMFISHVYFLDNSIQVFANLLLYFVLLLLREGIVDNLASVSLKQTNKQGKQTVMRF